MACAATRSIAVPQGADEGEAAENFAADLMDKWGVGDASCNDGVLLLLTLHPRQVGLSTPLRILQCSGHALDPLMGFSSPQISRIMLC